MGELQQSAAPRAATRNPTAAVGTSSATYQSASASVPMASRTSPTAALREASAEVGRANLAPLVTAAVASLLASSCCLLPLALATAGLTGAWLSHLRVLQPYSPFLIGIAIAALALASRSLFGTDRTSLGHNRSNSDRSRGTDRGDVGQSGVGRSESGFTLLSSRTGTTCRVDGVKPRALYRVMFWLVAALTLLLLVTPVVAPWFY